jgi:trans-aconitate 2-methyltransferase
MWSPRRYRAYASHRARPFFELLDRVGVEAPSYVVDLGCGPGERTADLAARWPGAVVEGIDGSEQMIAEARRIERLGDRPPAVAGASRAIGSAPPGDGPAGEAAPRLRFRVGDIAEWVPGRPVDVIFSSAALHWVPGHRRLLPGWVEALAPGGRLAFGVPGNFAAPSHVILRELCEAPRWRDLLSGTVRHDIVAEPAEYLGLLAGLGCEVDAWETTYLQVLPGEDPVLDWVRGTALRPVLDALPAPAAREEFLAELGARLREAYPRGPHGTVFPFRRIFVVAGKAISPI